jgi:hypothetical protein
MKKVAIVAGGTAAAAALLYYLLAEEDKLAPKGGAAAPSGAVKPFSQMTKADTVEILDEIVVSQKGMSALMKDVVQVILGEDLDLKKVYDRVKAKQPQDPLERRQLSIQEFDQLLDKHQSHDEVKEKIGQIMSAGSVASEAPSDAQPVPLNEIVSVHEYMQQELQKIVEEYKAWASRDQYDKKTLTISAQALVAARVQKKYKYSSEQVEAGVVANHTQLSQDQQFAKLNLNMQQLIGQLMES